MTKRFSLAGMLKGLRFRLLLLMVVAMLPLFLFVLVGALEGRETIAREYEAEQYRLTKLITGNIEQHLEASEQLLYTLSKYPSVQNHETEVCNELFARLLERFPNYTNLWTVDRTGTSRCSALELDPGALNIADASWFQEAVEQGSYLIGPFATGRVTGLPILPLVMPLFDDNGEVAGVVGAGLSIDWLNDYVATLDMPEGSRLTLTNADGVVLAVYPPNEELLGVDGSANPMFAEIASRQDGTIRGAWLTDVERLFGFSRVGTGTGGLFIVLGIPEERAYSELTRGISSALNLLLAVTLLAIVIAWVAGDIVLLRPIKQLAETAQRLGQGDLKTRVRLRHGVGELNMLADNFNQMAEELEKRSVELAETNRSLLASNQELAYEIDERKRAEAELKHFAAQLEASNQELEQFAYVASHDLQEPLRVVAGYLQLIERRYKNKLDSDADEFIAFAVDAAKRMQTLINDLLSYSRIGRKGRPFEPTDCNQVLNTALSNLRVLVEDEKAVITSEHLPTVEADPAQLTMVFQNLIANAVKFRREAPPLIRVGAVECSDHWRFSVSDNGIGIDPQYSERIFLIFQRLHTREEYPGTGIGLAICQKIVEHHGGRIWVEPNDDQGTTFYFTLPKMRETERL
ncbi:MAG: ATP-binding protein [Chloroflexota bacterium]|nr:MAG: hypothetical protein DIU68_03310 [Chloroflexota bacterium]